MRDPTLAAVLSLIIPGVGQLYNGRILAGILTAGRASWLYRSLREPGLGFIADGLMAESGQPALDLVHHLLERALLGRDARQRAPAPAQWSSLCSP